MQKRCKQNEKIAKKAPVSTLYGLAKADRRLFRKILKFQA